MFYVRVLTFNMAACRQCCAVWWWGSWFKIFVL